MDEKKLLKMIYLQMVMSNAALVGVVGYLKTDSKNYLEEALKDIEEIGNTILELTNK